MSENCVITNFSIAYKLEEMFENITNFSIGYILKHFFQLVFTSSMGVGDNIEEKHFQFYTRANRHDASTRNAVIYVIAA